MESNSKETKNTRIDRYNLSPMKCINCSAVLDYDRRKYKFCSKSCAATMNNKLRSSESREKQKNTLKHRYTVFPKPIPPKNRIYYKKDNVQKPGKSLKNTCETCESIFEHSTFRKSIRFCSVLCYHRFLSIKQSERMQNVNFRRDRYGRHKRSWLETSFEKWLIDHKISRFTVEHKIVNVVLKKTYFVDFFFENLKLIIELDGTQHRNTIDQDKIRDDFLRSLGYNVLRITHNEYIKKSKLPLICKLLGITECSLPD